MGTFIDLTGERFGMLTVINRAANYEKFSKTHGRILKYAMWDCICDCGNYSKSILSTDLKSGSQTSCGCVRKDLFIGMLTKHGFVGTKEYRTWKNMKSRCYNKNNKAYKHYGGRGITIQDSWLNDFTEFLNYVGNAPSDDYSIDRINSNGNYEEGNVRWALPTTQVQNRRRSSKYKNKYKWVHYSKKDNKYKGVFSLDGVRYYTGTFLEETDAAIAVYELYYNITGEWPKYIGEDLKELGLI